MGDKEDEKPSWFIIIGLILISIFIFIWNYNISCTPYNALTNYTPTKTNKLFFPITKIYYFVSCNLFWIVPFLLLVKSANLLIKKIT